MWWYVLCVHPRARLAWRGKAACVLLPVASSILWSGLGTGCEIDARRADEFVENADAIGPGPDREHASRDASRQRARPAATSRDAAATRPMRPVDAAPPAHPDATPAARWDAASVAIDADSVAIDASPRDATDRPDNTGPSRDASPGDSGAEAAVGTKPEPLADQTPPAMVNGISIDEDGYLWVAAGWDAELLRLEPPGERIVERHATDWELDGPDDLVATPEAVYYTAMAAGNVNELDRRTGENRVLAAVGLGVNPIALASDGALLVGIAPGPFAELAPFFTGLYEVDVEGARKPRTLLRDSRSINAFCIAPDGHVYGPAQHAVLRIDLATSTITTIRDGFAFLGAVRHNPHDGRLYTLDVYPEESPRAAILYRMELDGSDFEVFARLSPVSQDTFSADNFAIAEDGTFYVTRLYEPKITRVSADGSRTEDFWIGQ